LNITAKNSTNSNEKNISNKTFDEFDNNMTSLKNKLNSSKGINNLTDDERKLEYITDINNTIDYDNFDFKGIHNIISKKEDELSEAEMRGKKEWEDEIKQFEAAEITTFEVNRKENEVC